MSEGSFAAATTVKRLQEAGKKMGTLWVGCGTCARIRSMRSGPVMPSGNPGKFSTSVVVISCPPRTPPACRAVTYPLE